MLSCFFELAKANYMFIPPQYEQAHRRILEFDWDGQIARIQGKAAAVSAPQAPDDPPATPPAKILASWSEILEALDLKRKDRTKIARLNKTRGGPIKIGKRGQQPMVDHAKLRQWYDRLLIEYEAGENRARDAKPTTAANYEYGPDGVAIPDIGGGERKRRADWRP